MQLHNLTAAQAAAAVRTGQYSALELAEQVLNNLAGEKQSPYLTVTAETAREQARAVDRRLERGEELPLAGVPLALKDDLCFAGVPATCASKLLENYVPTYTATAAAGLIRAGAVLIGKTRMDEFSMGAAGGRTANPHDHTRTAGDGAAAALAAGYGLLAGVSDTGGAARLSAAYCGLFALRPTTGRVSRYGLVAHASSFAQPALLARHPDDLALALEAVSGYDPSDAATAAFKDQPRLSTGPEKAGRLTAGWPAALIDELTGDHRRVLTEARDRLGVAVTEVALPHFQAALQAYYVVALAESSSNLSRYDGIRYGTHHEGTDLEEWYLQTRRLMGKESRRRSVLGAYLLSGSNYDKYYRKALQLWTLVRRDFLAALEQCDLLLLPAAASTAALLAEQPFTAVYEQDRYTTPVSLAGLPALCMPAGTLDGLPLGLQLVGRPFAEEMLLELARRSGQSAILPPPGAPEGGN